jgi:hypothetical protein
VADEDQSSLKIVDSICQGVDGFDIQVVRWLIEKEEMRLLP